MEDTKKNRNQEKRYSITFDPETTRRIRELAQKEGTTMANILKRALNFYKLKEIAEKENMYIELVGKDKDGKEKRIRILIGDLGV